MNKAIKRIANIDMKKIKDLTDSNIYIEFNESNIFKAYAIIFGPSDTLYQGSVLFFEIDFPINYPFSPLKIKYINNGNNTRIHPNIYVNGKVCLSILGTWSGPKWTSIMDVSSVLLSIKSLLDNEPLHNEPGYTNKNIKKNIELSKSYNEVILHNCVYYLYYRNSKYIPENFRFFEKLIDTHFIQNKVHIDNIIEKNKDIKIRIEFPLYRIYQYIEYNKL